MNAFFNAQFNYCPFIWMLHSRQKNNNKIKHLYERCLSLIHNDKLSSYEELLEKDESVSIHHKNIQSLAIKMFQIKHGQSPEIVSDILIFFSIIISDKNRDFRIHSLRNQFIIVLKVSPT